MKYTFGEFREHFAVKRGFASYSKMSTVQQRFADRLINEVIDAAWFHKQWNFSGTSFRFTTIPTVSGIVSSGTAGEREVTLSSAISTSYDGVKVAGQLILLGSRLYKIRRLRSTTVLILDAPLKSSLSSGDSYKIYFAYYPLLWDVGAIRSLKLGADQDLTYVPEYVSQLDNSEGTPEEALHGDPLVEDFLNSGTVTATDGSNELTYSSSVSIDHVGHSLLLKESNAFQWFTIIDVDTTINKFILDRPYNGSGGAGLSFAIDPRGLNTLMLKPYPISREVVTVHYTRVHPKLSDADDETLFPDDTPILVGVEAVATLWEAAGQEGTNEVLFRDTRFVNSLKALSWRGRSFQARVYSLPEVRRLRNWPRNTNPWNSLWR